ncbi:2-amino-4-hydroxy-6-hydroxymethyldihydropteridine diphosphokinase [Alloscardovia macacae]|uniref:Bifunctional folate synthesis protein n=1 Tax=Alloscardovia macacae TaxID=1160091 RepID=A0A261F7K0_9BIFI|nr:2-amino-4-hydroxy-6-hydroxymethyldihydropteridine diphosphokinase [Alloscardovia macacae]OZG55064.1 dihydroneopterin aldolase [Alloscardovia macacae]
MDYITLTGVSALGTHGVLDFEHTDPQPFVVDATLYLDLSDASRSDDLADTVSYAQIADRIVSVIQGEHCDLIERLAQRIADSILLLWRVQRTVVTVHKPKAPIEQDFGDVSVTIEREQPSGASYGDEKIDTPTKASQAAAEQTEQTEQVQDPPELHTAILALGGNVGDVSLAMREAIVSLDALPGNQITGISALYRTAPWGVPGAEPVPDFYNAVVELSTPLSARELLEHIHTIEAEHGRTRDVHWDSRTLDIDIIDFNGTVSADPDLTLPHPRAWQRAFVLRPWLDVQPNAQLVGEHEGAVAELAQRAPDAHAVQLESLDWILQTGRTKEDGQR